VEHMAAALARYVGRPLTPEALAQAKEEALRHPHGLSRQAAALGSAAHASLEDLVRTRRGAPGLREVDGWLREWEEMGYLWHPELALGSPVVGAAGRIDLLGVSEDGDAVLADLKTSRAVHDSHRLQLGVYVAIAQALGLNVRRAYVLLLPRTGEGLKVEELAVDVWSQAAHHATSLFWALHRDLLSQDASDEEESSWEEEELPPWEEE